MASYKKYAEDLIGNWETGQYEPQRTVTKNIYQTNMDKLANDFNALKDKLARNFQNAQTEYANTMSAIQNDSFNRMRNANIDLANRGLSTSGVGNLVGQADTQRKGEDVDKALSNLLAVNNASAEGLTEGTMKLGQNQTSLAGDLAGDLGNITDKETANAQQYANLIAGIGQGAANRAASRARSGTSSRNKKAQEEVDELKRRMLISDTLSSDQFSDEEKVRYLYNYLDVPIDTARKAVEGYTNNAKLESIQPEIQNLQSNLNKWNRLYDIKNSNMNDADRVANSFLTLGGILDPVTARQYTIQNSINNLNNEINGLTYTDLYDLLYGRK